MIDDKTPEETTDNPEELSPAELDDNKSTTETITGDFIKHKAEKVTPDDIENIVSKKERILTVVRRIPILGRYFEDIIIMLDLLMDYISGNYKAIPFWVIGSIVVALAYLLSPADFIPDFIPLIGYVDDALVIGVCLQMIENDLENYLIWKANHGLAY